jgi:hypothetical protein
MSFSPVLVFHISAGTLSLLSGTAAMSFRKGSHRHRVTGNVFVIAMLCLSASGAYLGFMKHQTLNGLQGVLTFYLVATAWFTARRRDAEVGAFDWSALPVPLAVGAALVTYGLEAVNSPAGIKGGYPVSRGISSACAMRCSPPARPFSWDSHKYSPRHYAKQTSFLSRLSCH